MLELNKSQQKKGVKQPLNVPAMFTKAVIESLNLKQVAKSASFNEFNRFECSFNMFNQYLEMKFKLKGCSI